ncbi:MULTISPECIES: hypothetical protein [unclassified Streptomyces]|uniref:hypothetical protein n=1 Tax=unclassified Streptomyces TaxID=2593676 RepID=UPI003659C891
MLDLTRALACELGPSGVCVNTPGAIQVEAEKAILRPAPCVPGGPDQAHVRASP